MFRIVIFSVYLIAFARCQDEDPFTICEGYEDGTKIAFNRETSCTGYYDCYDNYGYAEDCAAQFGDDYQFNEETGDCDTFDNVQCYIDDYQYPDPDPVETEPPAVDPPVVVTTQAPVATTIPDSTIPEIECPTNQPGQILFYPSGNCSEYYICSNGNKLKLACMEGFTWNQQERQCDYPIFSKCSSNVEDDGLTVRCTRTGFYSTAYPRDCTKFVYCSAGIPMIQACPIGYAWNIDRCVERIYASCPDVGRRLIG